MGRCARCGMPMPGDVIGAVCLNCQRQTASQRSGSRENKTAGRSQAPSQPGYTLSSDEYGNTVKTYANGTQTVYTPKQVKRSFWRTIIILILLAAGVFVGIKYYSYSKNESNLLAPFEITQTESGDGSNVISTALSGSSTYEICELTVSPKKEGFISSIFSSSSDCAKTSNFTVDGKTVYRYYFSGYDFGTGLEGEFYLTDINGKRALIDDDHGKVYMEGSEFFGKHIEKLEAFNSATVLKPLTEKVTGGEYGINSEYYVLKNDGVSLSCSRDGNRINVLDESGKVRLSYKVRYYESSMGKLPNYSKYEIVE
jgi:hypothetical protein